MSRGRRTPSAGPPNTHPPRRRSGWAQGALGIIAAFVPGPSTSSPIGRAPRSWSRGTPGSPAVGARGAVNGPSRPASGPGSGTCSGGRGLAGLGAHLRWHRGSADRLERRARRRRRGCAPGAGASPTSAGRQRPGGREPGGGGRTIGAVAGSSCVLRGIDAAGPVASGPTSALPWSWSRGWRDRGRWPWRPARSRDGRRDPRPDVPSGHRERCCALVRAPCRLDRGRR